MGLSWSHSEKGSSSGIGVRLANFHRIGTLCCFNEEFIIGVSTGAR